MVSNAQALHPPQTPAPGAADYARIAAAIDFVLQHVEQQPSLETVAAHLGLSPWHFQRLFARWAGVSPKRYLQVLTVERAKALLRESASLLAVSEQLGLSSGSRLYDHFVTLEAVTPGQFKSGGEALQMDYGVHDTPFGRAFLALTSRGICRLAFVDDDGAGERAALAGLWPRARLTGNPDRTRRVMEQVFRLAAPPDRPLSLLVSGSNFQVSVWRALLQLPPGTVTSYARLARVLGRPRAARAVGRAVGANPLAFVIPCHRVITENGGLGGYHWGTTRKHAMHVWESARRDAPGT